MDDSLTHERGKTSLTDVMEQVQKRNQNEPHPLSWRMPWAWNAEFISAAPPTNWDQVANLRALIGKPATDSLLKERGIYGTQPKLKEWKEQSLLALTHHRYRYLVDLPHATRSRFEGYDTGDDCGLTRIPTSLGCAQCEVCGYTPDPSLLPNEPLPSVDPQQQTSRPCPVCLTHTGAMLYLVAYKVHPELAGRGYAQPLSAQLREEVFTFLRRNWIRHGMPCVEI